MHNLRFLGALAALVIWAAELNAQVAIRAQRVSPSSTETEVTPVALTRSEPAPALPLGEGGQEALPAPAKGAVELFQPHPHSIPVLPPHAGLPRVKEALPTRAVFIVDFSESMCAPSSGPESRLSVAQWALYDLLDAVPDGMPVAIVALQKDASVLRPLQPLQPEEKLDLRRTVMKMRPHGNCELALGIQVAGGLLPKNPHEVTCFVVVTDGFDCNPSVAIGHYAQLAQEQCLHLTVIGVGCGDTPTTALRSLAMAGRGTAGFVSHCKQLPPALAGPITRFNGCRAAAEKTAQQWYVELVHCRHEEAHLTACIAELKVQNHVLEEKLAETTAELAKTKTSLVKVRTERDHLKGDLEQAQARIHRLFHYVNWLWFLIVALAAAVVSLAVAAFVLRGRLIRATTQLAACECQKQELEHRLCVAEKNEAEARREAECLQRQLADLEASHARLQEQLKCCQAALCECETRETELKHQLATCEAKLEDQARTIAALSQRVAVVEGERDHARADADRLQSDVNELSCALKHCEEEKLECVKAAENLHCRVERLVEELRCCERNESAAATKAGQLEKLVEQLNRDNFQLSTWLGCTKTEAAVAEEKALGATREMAANKKDCCCPPPCSCCPAPSVVYGPVTTPNGPVTPVTTPGAPVTTDSSAPTVTSPQATPSTPSTAPAVGGGPGVGGQGGGPGVGGAGGQVGSPGGIAGSPGGIAGAPGAVAGGPGGVAGAPGGVAGAAGGVAGAPGGVAGSPGSSGGGGGLPGMSTSPGIGDIAGIAGLAGLAGGFF